jgi:hypothetical protein
VLTVGFDVAKEFHWVSVTVSDPVTGKAGEVLSRRVGNTPGDIAAAIDQIIGFESDHGLATVGIDVLGGIARLLEVMLLHAGLSLVHGPGLAGTWPAGRPGAGSTRATRGMPG